MSKMAAKSKKRLSKNENKLLKLEKLEISDLICSICQSILIEPVTLPCFHDFCQRCFSGTIENNALCCPLCRLRIGSWLRKTSKQKTLFNNELWKFIKNKFPKEIEKKLKGEDLELSPEKPLFRLSLPGEIRSEYEAEIKRLRAERFQLEQKHLQETENLIQKLQQEEEEAHKQYIERLKQDEILALKIQQENLKLTEESANVKQKVKTTKIDAYLSKIRNPVNESPTLIDDTARNSDSSTAKTASMVTSNQHSPEITPTYGKFLKKYLDKNPKSGTRIWNKENGKSIKTKSEVFAASNKETSTSEGKNVVKSKNVIQSLVVSLPLPCSGILQNKTAETESRSVETGSVDSMRQELCYFKPIEGTTPTSFNTGKTLPLRVPVVRVEKDMKSPEKEPPPSRAQYLDSLCQLRNLSLAQKLPSAFVIALSVLRVNKESTIKCVTRSRTKKRSPTSVMAISPTKKNGCNRYKQSVRVDGIAELNTEPTLRRTRSMGSISKDENEVTPKKKINIRKISSERKPYLRSDSKKLNAKKETCGSPLLEESFNNNKVNLVVKNLSSPLDNCDVKTILREQLRIEKIIEQEKSDFELAQKVEAEWNGRAQLRRAGAKRQVTLNYALRPAKKVKV